jgi:hypothetical protein
MRLAPEDHKLIALWAAECAVRALGCFEQRYPDDVRPRGALEAVTAWAHDRLNLGAVHKASLLAFAAARGAERGASSLAGLSAGHAAAAAYKLRHARCAAEYARVALHFERTIAAEVVPTTGERDYLEGAREVLRKEELWQFSRLPRRLRSFIFPVAMLN